MVYSDKQPKTYWEVAFPPFWEKHHAKVKTKHLSSLTPLPTLCLHTNLLSENYPFRTP